MSRWMQEHRERYGRNHRDFSAHGRRLRGSGSSRRSGSSYGIRKTMAEKMAEDKKYRRQLAREIALIKLGK